MISRRSILLGGGTTLALAAGIGLHRLSSISTDIRAPLLYAFGLYEFARRIQILSGQLSGSSQFDADRVEEQIPDWNGEPLINREIHVRELSDPSSRAVTTPNNDTLYTSAILDLTAGPVEVVAPESRERYVSIAFMNPFNDQVAYIGTRATDGRGGRFWVVGPGHSSDVPDDVTPIRVKSNDLWMLGRVFVAGEDDLADARAVQSQISARAVNPAKPVRHFVTKPPERADAKSFLALTNEILARNPAASHTARASIFEAFGIIPGRLDAFEGLSPDKKFAWSRAVDQVEDKIMAQVKADEKNAIGWTTPPRILGNYGTNDTIRAGTALVGFGALTVDEAVYYNSSTDAAGTPLNGDQTYRMVLPAAGVPTDAFWSLSMYAISSDQRLFFYENELGRFSINSHSDGLLFQPDGSIILAFQRERPSDPSLVWMPTPEGAFKCVFRAYLPGRAIREGRWTPPPIVPNG